MRTEVIILLPFSFVSHLKNTETILRENSIDHRIVGTPIQIKGICTILCDQENQNCFTEDKNTMFYHCETHRKGYLPSVTLEVDETERIKFYLGIPYIIFFIHFDICNNKNNNNLLNIYADSW